MDASSSRALTGSRPRPGLFAIVAIAAVIAAACSGGTSSTPKALGGGHASVRIQGEWDTLDPHKNYGFVVAETNPTAYDYLLRLDPSTTKFAPYVATQWILGNNSINFTLRNDVVCSDGTPVDGRVVADSFNRYIKVGMLVGSVAGGIRAIYGADGNPSMSAADATHVTLSWSGKYTAENVLDVGPAIVCPAGLQADADYNAHSYGSGPFVMTTATHGVGISYKVHKGWKWGPYGTTAATLPDTLDLKIVTNPTTTANLLTTGGLDAGLVTGPDIDRLLNEKSLHVVKLPGNVAEVLGFNAFPGHPLEDPVLRQAVSMSIDPKAYNIAENNGHGTLVQSIFAPQMPCYSTDAAKLYPSYSVDKARSLLQAHGYTYSGASLTKDGKPITLTVIGETGQNAGPEYLRNQLTHLGATVDLQVTDFTTWLPKLNAGKYDVAEVEYSGITVPQVYLRLMVGPTIFQGGSNPWAHNNQDAYQSYLAAKAATGDARCKDYEAVQVSLAKGYSGLPLLAQTSHWFASTKWTFKMLGPTSLDPTTLQRTS